jgi:ADP-heptose:LPS heptosyltransferase
MLRRMVGLVGWGTRRGVARVVAGAARRGRVSDPPLPSAVPYHRPGVSVIPAAVALPHEPRRILAVKLFALGDLLNTTPALRALRERFPAARIDVLTTRQGKPGLAGSPHVNDVIVFDKSLFDQVGGVASPRALWVGLRFALGLRLRRYDTLVLLHHLITPWGTIKYTILALWSGAKIRAGLDNGRGWFLTHRAADWGFGVRDERQYWLDVVAAIGARSDDDRPLFAVPQADRAAGAALAARARGERRGPLIVIHPTNGTYAPGRQWSPARFAAVADRLAEERDAAIVLVGVQGEAEGIGRVAAAMRQPALNLAGQTTLPTLAGLILATDLVIGNDSSVGHLAAALGTPTIALFGPSNDQAWRPWGAASVTLPADGMSLPALPATHALAVRSADPHAPCIYTGYGPGNPDGCKNCRCLDLLDADRVAAIACRLLTSVAENETPLPPRAYIGWQG